MSNKQHGLCPANEMRPIDVITVALPCTPVVIYAAGMQTNDEPTRDEFWELYLEILKTKEGDLT